MTIQNKKSIVLLNNKSRFQLMKRILPALAILFFIFGCADDDDKTATDSVAVKPADSSIKKTDTAHIAVLKDSTKLVGPHLSDTAMFAGSWVIFLRPDSARFDFYDKKMAHGLNEADADFGAAISMAIDSIVGNQNFKGIKGMVSTKRYITLLDCKGGPLTIDRDTVNYGIILTGTDRVMRAEQNVYGGEHYIKVVRKYFGLKGH
jgi:hypothetical protein